MNQHRQTFVQRETFSVLQFVGERFWGIGERIDFLAGSLVVAQLHNVVDVSCLLISPDMKNVDQARMLAGDGREFPDAVELALQWPSILEIALVQNFYGVEIADDISRQPDFAVSASAYAAKQFVIRNQRRVLRGDGGRLPLRIKGRKRATDVLARLFGLPSHFALAGHRERLL